MTSIRVKRSDLKSDYDGSFEQYLREEYGLREDVELASIKDGGMYGNRDFVFETPDGELVVGGYISSGIGPSTYSMTVFGERSDRLFGGDDGE